MCRCAQYQDLMHEKWSSLQQPVTQRSLKEVEVISACMHGVSNAAKAHTSAIHAMYVGVI